MTDPTSSGSYSNQAWDEQQWRRPEHADEAATAPVTPPPPVYSGPPRSDPAAVDWRPQTVIQVPPARRLPTQDDSAIDLREQQARTVTLGIGLITGALALIVLFVLCGRVLF